MGSLIKKITQSGGKFGISDGIQDLIILRHEEVCHVYRLDFSFFHISQGLSLEKFAILENSTTENSKNL